MSDSADPTPMPDMFETVLQPNEIDEYLADLSACAQHVAVTVRQGRQQILDLPSGPLGLDVAVRRLRDGEATSLQVRYRCDGVAWCDTLGLVPGGVRLLRVAQPDV
jgi:hypothetical protein